MQDQAKTGEAAIGGRMILDAQEYINELKTYRRYLDKLNIAENKYQELETVLGHLESSYVSPSAVNMVETVRYVKGRRIRKLIPLPKLDPDPNRKNILRSGLIDQQCSLIKEISYYKRKIKRIKETSDLLPDDLRHLCFDVYVRKKGEQIAHENHYSLSALYIKIRKDLESIFEKERQKMAEIKAFED